MNVLVAGGAGFIGSHLIDRLLSEGHMVICLDKLIMGDGNIHHLFSEKGFRFYETDLCNQDELESIFQRERIDMVYHLAANSDIKKGGTNPSIDYNNTFLTTRNILECMREFNVKNLFFSSTSAVYGEMPNCKLTEVTGGLMPVSFYGGAKLASEALISSYAYMCEMNVIVFRFPNVIGPRLTHGVIYDFIRKLRDNPLELEVLGDGTQCKPYIYVKDLVNAIMYLTKSIERGVDIYNISVNGNGTTVSRIAEYVIAEMGLRDVTIKYSGGARGWKGDVPYFSYDISKVLSTGWIPELTSDEAVRQTICDVLSAKERYC